MAWRWSDSLGSFHCVPFPAGFPLPTPTLVWIWLASVGYPSLPEVWRRLGSCPAYPLWRGGGCVHRVPFPPHCGVELVDPIVCPPPLSPLVWRWCIECPSPSPCCAKLVGLIGLPPSLPCRVKVVEFMWFPLPSSCGVEVVGFIGFPPLTLWCGGGAPH